MQTFVLVALPGKNDNIEPDNNSSSMTIGKNGRAENLASRPGFLIFRTKLTFAKLKKAFIKASILHYFERN